MFSIEDEFLRRGMATLALDGPEPFLQALRGPVAARRPVVAQPGNQDRTVARVVALEKVPAAERVHAVERVSAAVERV